jgi:hypothetical protein
MDMQYFVLSEITYVHFRRENFTYHSDAPATLSAFTFEPNKAKCAPRYRIGAKPYWYSCSGSGCR